jgi:hypothetical protein
VSFVRFVAGLVTGIILASAVSAFGAAGFVNSNTWNPFSGNDQHTRTVREALHSGYVAGVLDTIDLLGSAANASRGEDKSAWNNLLTVMEGVANCLDEHRYAWHMGDYTNFAEAVMLNPPRRMSLPPSTSFMFCRNAPTSSRLRALVF